MKTNNILITLLVIFVEEVVFLILFQYLKADPNIIASLMTAIALFGSYFIVHDLEVLRIQKTKKLELCLEMIKNLRLLLNEPYYMGKEEQKKFRDQFINSYYQFSLLVSKEAYIKLETVVERFIKFLQNEEHKAEFKKAQNEFINQLREELADQEKINFCAYAIKVPIDDKT